MTKPKTKIDRLIARLKRDKGATIEELARLTGWQKHSVRGAMAGSLKKKGFVVSSEKVGAERRYRIVETAGE
ncbi:DUF3489 domain-containing protein [Sphingomicrobium arenosum]|uniref:DUF3489 domain-containing protein n=1 Tax=Sphingomicrobium arenosum TaxID=2233861 RepID=UPI002240EACB|nr:DUF3489 domain-containing protein [Sphingomicrobium arenosum]